MLPDPRELKRLLHVKYMQAFRSRLNTHLGIFSLAKRSLVVEGENTSMVRPNGEVEDTTLHTASTEAIVKYEEVPLLDHEGVMKILDRMAEKMAAQISAGFAEEVGDAAEKVGNVVTGAGKPIGPEKIFEVWEKIQIDFGPDGQPKMPSIVAGSDMFAPMTKALQAIETIPEWQTKMNELINRKYEDWRAREADRKLVG